MSCTTRRGAQLKLEKRAVIMRALSTLRGSTDIADNAPARPEAARRISP